MKRRAEVLLGFGNLEVSGDFDKSILGERWGQMDRMMEAGRLALRCAGFHRADQSGRVWED